MRIKTESRRNAILDTAAQAFLEAGFQNTSMSQIALRVGGSKGTLYNYFTSKEEIFLEAMDRIGERQFFAAFTNLKMSEDIGMALKKFGAALIQSLCSPEAIALRRILIAEAGRSDIGRLFFEQGPQKAAHMVESMLKAAMDAGQLRESNPRIAGDHLRGLLESEYFEKCLLGVIVSPDARQARQAANRAVEIFLAAYKPAE